MRKYQKKYFQTRSKYDLSAAKFHEMHFDNLLEDYLKEYVFPEEPKQLGLF